MPIKWHGDKAEKRMRRYASRGVKQTANAVRDGAKLRISIPGPPPAPPHEPPHIDQGDLIASVRALHPVDLISVVGTDKDYGRFQEYGWHQMGDKTTPLKGPRPWLRPEWELLRKNWAKHFTDQKL